MLLYLIQLFNYPDPQLYLLVVLSPNQSGYIYRGSTVLCSKRLVAL